MMMMMMRISRSLIKWGCLFSAYYLMFMVMVNTMPAATILVLFSIVLWAVALALEYRGW